MMHHQSPAFAQPGALCVQHTPKPSTQLSQIHADFFRGISAFICVNLCQK